MNLRNSTEMNHIKIYTIFFFIALSSCLGFSPSKVEGVFFVSVSIRVVEVYAGSYPKVK
jgi:hypothetical protein